MSILKLHTYPASVLCKMAVPIIEITDEHRRLVEDMIDTMHLNQGIGLAAPQVGSGVRLIVVCPTGRRGEELVIINPVISNAKGRERLKEGCLSLPGLQVEICRAKELRLQGKNPKGGPIDLKTEGLLARALQHEVDHLNGILLFNKVPFWRRRRLLRQLVPA